MLTFITLLFPVFCAEYFLDPYLGVLHNEFILLHAHKALENSNLLPNLQATRVVAFAFLMCVQSLYSMLGNAS